MEPDFTENVMEVIPLAGDDSFWVCNFLVGFTVNEHVLKHHWKIVHNNE